MWWALPVILVGTFMTILDFFIVNVAIPSIQADLRASAAQIQLVVAGYGLAYAVGLITGGRLGDIAGRRRMFMIGMLAFTAASAACGLAPSAPVLVAARVAQGLSSAMLFPQVLSILNVTYTGKNRARAFTAFGVTLGLAAVAGQLLGGVLIAGDVFGLGWRSCFLINVPVGLAALALTPSLVPESRSDAAGGLDLRGAGVITAGLALLVFPLVEGRQAGWPGWSFGCLAAAPLVLLGFAVFERRLAAKGGAPLIAPALFRQRAFVVGIAVVLAFYAGLASLFLVLAVYLQDGQRFGALASGVVFLPLALGFFATSVNATRLAQLLGRQALAAGAALMAVSYLVLIPVVGAAGGHVSGWALAPGLLLNGLGEGAVMGPIIALVLAGVRPEDAGSAAGVLATVQQIAGAIGVAVIGIVFYGSLGTHPHPGAPYARAFQHGLAYTLVLVLVVAALVQLLPRTAASGRS
jgi:EmrB/QacA subfamily drug resistance transporter